MPERTRYTVKDYGAEPVAYAGFVVPRSAVIADLERLGVGLHARGLFLLALDGTGVTDAGKAACLSHNEALALLAGLPDSVPVASVATSSGGNRMTPTTAAGAVPT